VEQVGSLKTGVKHKDTPIGRIPVDWEVASLGKIARLEYGASLPEEKRRKGGFPVYGSNGILGYHAEALVDGPGIIIGRKGTVGTIRWTEKSFWPTHTTYYISKNQSKVYLKWLFYLLWDLHLERLHITTGAPGLNREQTHLVTVAIPPFIEQERIAEILTTVDSAIEKTSQLIEKTKELKRGLMQRLLTRGIGHERFKQTQIGEIPYEWRLSRLPDLCIGKADNLPRDINGDGKVLDATWHSIETGPARPYDLKVGDILFAKSGATVGKAYLYSGKDGNCGFGRHLIRFRLDPSRLLPQFLFHFTRSPHYRNWVKAILRAREKTNISAREYSNMFLPKPPIEEQKKISAILTSLNDDIEKESEYKEKLELVKKRLVHMLFKGKLRVIESSAIPDIRLRPAQKPSR
jgi:type I restriction enzyme S subunit